MSVMKQLEIGRLISQLQDITTNTEIFYFDSSLFLLNAMNTIDKNANPALAR
jgi:hypothetical protein